MDWIRQGDIAFVRAEADPKIAKRRRVRKTVVAEGEITGHHHVLEGDLLVDQDRFPNRISVENGVAVLTHPEHATVEIPEGYWHIKRQREFWGETRRVLD